MRKVLFFLVILLCSLSVDAASYKVNSGGNVVSLSGRVQQNSAVLNPSNAVRNYYAPNYVSSRQASAYSGGMIDIVIDYSGSMKYWIDAAKQTISYVVAQLPSSTKIGLRAFGQHNGMNAYTPIVSKVNNICKDKNGNYKVSSKKASYLGSTLGPCAATSQVVPISPYDSDAIIRGMNSIHIGSSTPLTLSLEQAVEYDFRNFARNFPKKIILVTDGAESCGGNPCEFAKSLVSQRQDITIDVVLVSPQSQEIVCLAEITGGKIYKPSDVTSFANSLLNSLQDNVNNNSVQIQQQYEFIGN